MKKIEKLRKQANDLETYLLSQSFERKDKSFRRSGGYFGTHEADLSNCIVLSSHARTKNLNTYICVDELLEYKVKELNHLKEEINKLAFLEYCKESILKANIVVDNDIQSGVIHTNYGKKFFVGNKNIYYCHPFYGHLDYNKWCAMPNTPKHRKVAEMLNQKIEEAKKCNATI